MSRLGNKVVRWIYDGKKTTCLIQEPQEAVSKGETRPEPTVITRGEVVKYEKDISDKRLGRKLSFQRAMNRAVVRNLIPKTERTVIWNDFRTQIKQPVNV